jgi:cytochrome c553
MMTMNRRERHHVEQRVHSLCRRWVLLGVLMLCVSTLLSAASSRAEEAVSSACGHLITVGGGPGGAGTACFSCHGLQGQGDAGGAFPRLAGLDTHYFARQMNDYVSGARSNAVMTPIAQQLSPADRQSVAFYYTYCMSRRNFLGGRQLRVR